MEIVDNSASWFHPENCQRYFEARIAGLKFNGNYKRSLRCPFHDDSMPSFSVDLAQGVWKGHAGCGQGGIFDFEQIYSHCDLATARANVGAILGMSFSPDPTPEAEYVYHASA